MSLDRAAERCVIGALLLEPTRLDTVREWLEVGDFDGTAERQAYGALLQLRESELEIVPQAVDDLVRKAVPQGTQLADALYLVSVMDETPSPALAAVYGRMVLEMSIRRRVAEGAVQLRVRTEGATTADELNRVFADVDVVRRAVETLHRRESRAAETHSVAPATDDHIQPLMRFPHSEELAAEQAVVLTLTERPQHVGTVARWLKPNDFGDDECGALFKQIVAMQDAGNPIDRLTVAWRAAKVGIDGPVSLALVRGRSEATLDLDPVECGRRVLEQSVKAAIIATSQELETVVRDASTNPTTAAYTRLNALWPQQRRLVKAQVAAVRGLQA